MASKTGTDERGRLIRLIHVARRDLEMAEDTYRVLLQKIGGQDSAAALTVPALRRVVEHLKQCGFKVRSTPAGTRPMAADEQSRMIRGLWIELANLGVVKNPSEAALATFVKRQTGCDALQWLTVKQAQAVIEQLKKWRSRFPQQVDGGGNG
ncbi:gp16 family protein [Cupriavidus metallidurans]|uniref:Regulatory protein GemA n=1 Tax=Cupriavidus metallidurans TaxID=119219 RepID=A0A482IQL8_9BURK|nr:regulatory protein GemA [Cupriavidus metallidurans]QBP09817.1 regulatory protein GemA [Cupriavidus metallidurans]